MKIISVLGSTGSIGVSALDVIGRNPKLFQIAALAAGRNIGLLKRQIEKFRPAIAAVREEKDALQLRKALAGKTDTKIVAGLEGMKEAASADNCQMVISAISGAAGLIPTLTAIEAGKDIALANKETMVMAGAIVTKRAEKRGIRILPVDSEHSAIFQCLDGQQRENLKRIILTASGGPFLKYTKSQLARVKLSQALKHPNWKMGNKITIDSASMMNKGLEVIEAKWLFNVDIKHIDVLIHPQSIIHSLVEFNDGAVLGQLGIPDMRIPIAYALSYPERINNNLPALNLLQTGKLEFIKPDKNLFPSLSLAYEAGIKGGTMPAVLNAANEEAVGAFINGKIKFTDLPKIVEKVLAAHDVVVDPALNQILEADLWARQQALKRIERITV